jgi:hypothetical protein
MKIEINLSPKERYLEENRHGLICMIILIVGCLGGLTVGYGAVESVLTLCLVIIPTMTTLSLLLAVYPMKWIMNMTIISISIDLILIAYFFFTK